MWSNMRGCCAAVFVAVLLLSGCAAQPESPTSVPSARPTPTDVPVQTVSPAQPSSSPSGPATTAPSAPADSDQPVPKVGRGDDATPTIPTILASPADTDDKVSYPDGVILQIQKVSFGEETGKGPGAFPGREFAVLDLEIDNGSERALSLDTVVITVLDKDDQPVNPVYAEEAKVADFTGELKSGKTVKASYAFAVPKASRSKVTVVVDFDGVHASAVFRGELAA